MNAEQAFKIIGHNAHGVPFANMIKALQMCSALNTRDDNERLAAALWIKKHRKAYSAYCEERR